MYEEQVNYESMKESENPNDILRRMQAENSDLKASVLKRIEELREENKMLTRLLRGDELTSNSQRPY
jgi:hypothetical protein